MSRIDNGGIISQRRNILRLNDNAKSCACENAGNIYLTFLRVEIPNGKYNGQKFNMLVNKNTMANINNIMAVVPVILSLKYNPPIISAAEILRVLSKRPTFGFMICNLCKFI